MARATGAETSRPAFSPQVMAAIGRVPRHRLVPPGQVPYAYENRPLPIGHGQTISQPYIVALMTDLLDPKPSDVVLEIGTGSGYQAAVLAELVAKVYTIEIVDPVGKRAAEDLAALGYRNVATRIGDGYNGWAEAAPFDRHPGHRRRALRPEAPRGSAQAGWPPSDSRRRTVAGAGVTGDREEAGRLHCDATHNPGALRAPDPLEVGASAPQAPRGLVCCRRKAEGGSAPDRAKGPGGPALRRPRRPRRPPDPPASARGRIRGTTRRIRPLTCSSPTSRSPRGTRYIPPARTGRVSGSVPRRAGRGRAGRGSASPPRRTPGIFPAHRCRRCGRGAARGRRRGSSPCRRPAPRPPGRRPRARARARPPRPAPPPRPNDKCMKRAASARIVGISPGRRA